MNRSSSLACLTLSLALMPRMAWADEDASAVKIVPAREMTANFAKAATIRETPLYKVHASHREAPGLAEIHARDTDVIYVVEGKATLVTGGTAVDAKATAPDELRGTRIEGGEAHALAKGDVVIVPSGVPHWFEHVSGPFNYFVVKVTAPAPEASTGAATEAGSER